MRVELPEPGPDEREHSARLVDHILQAVDARGGAIPFEQYMALALYAPGLGYYSAGAEKLGAGGDFVTAPEVSPLFARCLARQCAEVMTAVDGHTILELGAGSGRLAADLLHALADHGTPPGEYAILEVSADLRARQQAVLNAEAPALADRVRWYDRPPEGPFNGVVLANEVVDALPAALFRIKRGAVFEAVVTRDDGAPALGWRPARPATAGAVEAVRNQLSGPLPDGYTSEVRPQLAAWLKAVTAGLGRGVVLCIDYGFPRHEYYHPERHQGTLMCHYRHRAHDDPLWWPGLQDMTCHVDFTALAEAGEAAGLHPLGFTSQASFLMGCGLDEWAAPESGEPDTARAERLKQVQWLVHPEEMGERFKAMALGRGVDGPLTGFSLSDQLHRL